MDNNCEQQVPSVTLHLWQNDNTGGEMTVLLGLQQLWSDVKSTRKAY